MRGLAAVGLLALAGCVDFGQALGQCTAQGRCTDPDGGRQVLVRYQTVHHAGGTGEAVLDDADADAVLIPDLAGLEARAPVARDAGLLAFAGAPGRFAVRTTRAGVTLHLDTVLERLDLAVHVAGRAGLRPADAGVAWSFVAENLSPWTAASDLHVLVANAGLSGLAVRTRAPDAGAVGGAMTLDWAGLPLPSAGDEALLTQRASRVFVDDAGAAYDQVGVTRFAARPAFAAGPIAFVAAPQVTMQLDWRRDEFRAVLPHPAATLAGSSLILGAVVEGSDAGVAPSDAALEARPFAAPVFELRPRTAAGDLNAAVDFGQPYPPQWPLAVTAVQRFRYARPLPDAGQSVDFAVVRRVEAAGTQVGPVRPGLAAPTGVTVEGFSFTADQVLASDHPVVAWTAPAGENLRYALEVVRLEPDGSKVVAATVLTSRTAVRIPAGVVVRGKLHFLRLTTRSTGADVDPDREPFAFRLPVSEVDLLSGTLELR